MRTKSQRSTRALHDVPVNREIAAGIELSTVTKPRRPRRALGDVSNKNSAAGAPTQLAVDESCEREITDNGMESLRRSKRLANGYETTRDNQKPCTEHESAAGEHVTSQQPVTESRGVCSQIENDDTTAFNAENVERQQGGAKTNADAARNKLKNRTKKRSNKGSLDIEALLLEPVPRNKRLKTITNISKRKKHIERNTMRVSGRNRHCPDLLETSEDDHCLLRKIEGPFDASKFTTGIATYDKANKKIVHEVPLYVTDIFQRLFYAENLSKPSPSYIRDDQPEINSTMRAILIDWLVIVHEKFRLKTETLYLCVNIIDRYLSRRSIPRRRLQLLGITSLFVASKYEEQFPPEVKDCVYITDRSYTRQEVLDMEFDIVIALDFKMTVPTAYPFLHRFLHITSAPDVVRHLASFYTERMLQEYCMLTFRPSLVASAAVCLAWNNPKARAKIEAGEIPSAELPRVLETIINYTGFCERRIRHTADVICFKIKPDDSSEQNVPPRKQLVGVSSKYRSERFSKVSDFPFPDVSHLDTY